MNDTGYRAPDGYLTLTQARERLGISRTTLFRALARMGIRTFNDPRNNRVRLVTVEDVDRLMQPIPR